MVEWYVGIDPGASGGIAALSGGGELRFSAWKGADHAVEWIRAMVPDFTRQIAFIERVHSMPAQGVSSTFKFGYNAGTWEGILHGMGVPHVMVSPQLWMKTLECLTGGVKRVTRDFARDLFPKIKEKSITLKTADAILIAVYAARTYGPEVK
jgi:hypothetical protein